MGRKAIWPPRAYHYKASGQAMVRWKGKDYYLGVWDSPEARAGYIALVARLDRQRAEPAGDGRQTVACVVVAWREHAEKTYGGSAECRAYDDAIPQLLDLFAALPTDEFGCDHLEQTRDKMVKDGLCRNVVNRRIVRIRTIWRFAERKGLAPKGSWSHLRSLRALRKGEGGVIESPRVKPAEWPDVEAVAKIVNPSVRGLLLVQWATGARPGELFPMKAGDLVMEDGIGVYRPIQHKNAWRNQERVIRFGDDALEAIETLLMGKEPGDLVFPNRRGAAYNRNSYRNAVAKACKKCGVSFHPYQLRHSAKRRFTRAISLDAARAALGQNSIMTTDRYAAGGDEKLADEVARKCG